MTTSNAYNTAFKNYARGRVSQEHTEVLAEGNDGFGGYAIPCGYIGDYTSALREENLFRQYGTVIKSKGDGHIQAVASAGEATIVAPNCAYLDSNDAFATYHFRAYKLASLSKLHNDFVSDENFDVQGYLNNEFAKRFGRAEEKVFLTGTGDNEPTGLLTSAEVGADTNALTYDDLISLYFSVKPEYRKNAVWIMNDNTALTLRSLKDNSGRYLWCDNDDTIFGKSVVISQYMPDIAAGQKPIAFGDLSYYWVIDRKPLSLMVLKEKFIMNDATGYAAHEYIDGKLIRPEAVKVLEIVEG